MSISEHFEKIFSAAQQDISERNFADICWENPYCSIAQFYLLLDLKNTNSPDFEKQARKTALYFSNINWLNWQLNHYARPADTKSGPIIANKLNLLKPTAQINNTADEVIAFEPLHTVDYFASQGIKITDEPIADDKLGHQMKSFTEWLKSMKNIHAQKRAEENEQNDNEIQHIAEGSNVKADILTESMAHILIKQNKLDKAIEMYEKLSLMNPSKSAYFASKIESLKSV